MIRRTRKKKESYIDNEKFLQELIDYRLKYNYAKSEGKPLPTIPNYTAMCFMKIAKRLATSKNYFAYPFREEMEGDAILCCVTYAHNFDESKSKNPFSYFTQVANYAFWNRIYKEKKHLYTKYKAIQNTEIFESFADHSIHDSGDDNLTSGYSEDSKVGMAEFVKGFEEWMSRRGKKVDV